MLDRSPENFRIVYAAGAALAALGVLAFSRVPIVGEADHLDEERAAHGDGNERGGMLSVLREDGDYARFMGWQMLLGVAAMMTEAPLLYLVSRQMGASYGESIGIMVVIPLALSVVAIPFWASFLDRVHVSSFRSVHSWVFAFAQALLWIGAIGQSLWILGLARVVNGAARSGGGLAWNIGHNDFAPSARAGLYMGVHVTLTGIRGAIAPFLGMALYLGWSARPIPFTGLALPAWSGLGDTLLILSAVLSSVAALGFRSLKRRIDRRG